MIEYEAHITNNETGETCIYEHDYPASEDAEDYLIALWDEGNFSCDCNRKMFFNSVKGLNVQEDFECGDGGYTVSLHINGKCIYTENR